MSEISKLSFATSKNIRREHRRLFGSYFMHALQLFLQAQRALQSRVESGKTMVDREQTHLERATKLLHLTPALLQSADGRIPRNRRYELYAAGDIAGMVEWLISFARQAPPGTSQDDVATKRARAANLAHRRGGVTKAATLLTSTPAPPRSKETLAILRAKHPSEDATDIADAKAEATALLQNPDPGWNPIPAADDTFAAESVIATIKRGNPQSAPGPSGLRYIHLQLSMSPALADTLSAFSQLVFEGTLLPESFWIFHTSSNLSALGDKARPVACGDLLRRVIGGTFCRQHGSALAERFQALGQYGVAAPGGVEAMALRATLGYQQGCAILTFDAKNAFNSIKRRAILPALAKLIPSVVPYVLNLYARGPPQLLFKTMTGDTEIVSSSTGVQQGCTLGPVSFSAGTLGMLREFRDNPPVADAQILSYIDDVVVILPATQAQNPRAVEAVATWLQQRMEPLGITLNLRKSQALFPAGTCVDQWQEDDKEILERTRLTVAPQGLKIVGIPVGAETYIKEEVRATTMEEPASLLRELTQLDDPQVSLQIVRLSAVTKINFLLRALPPALTHAAAAKFDALVEWALAAIVAGPQSFRDGLPSPQEVEHHPDKARGHPILSKEAIRQARLPVREGGLGLPSAVEVSGPAFIGCQALVLADVVAATVSPDLGATLSNVATTAHAVELRRELRKLAEFASGPQLAEMVGSSWAALAMDKDPAGRGIGALLVEAGATGTATDNPSPPPQSSPQRDPVMPGDPPRPEGDEAPELGAPPTSRPRVSRQAQSRITKVLFAHQGRQLLADLRARADTVVGQRRFVRYAGARSKGAMAWATCQGVDPRERVDPALFREILARNLGSHDIDTPLGHKCHEGCETVPSPVHALTCTRGGMQTHTHQTILHDFVTRTLRECRIPHERESTTPFKEGTAPGAGYLRMDVVVGSGTLFQGKDELKSSSLMFDVTVVNPLGPTALANSGARAGHALEEAVKAKKTKYGGTYRPTYKFLPLAFSTCGDYSASVHDLVKDLGRLKAELDEEYLMVGEGGQLAIQARETGRLRRLLSVTTQKALAYRSLRYANRQQLQDRRTTTTENASWTTRSPSPDAKRARRQ